MRRGPSQGLCIGEGPWAPAICQASEKELCTYLGVETGSSLSASGVSGRRLAEHSEPDVFPLLVDRSMEGLLRLPGWWGELTHHPGSLAHGEQH